jgi:hypothetical protein
MVREESALEQPSFVEDPRSERPGRSGIRRKPRRAAEDLGLSVAQWQKPEPASVSVSPGAGTNRQSYPFECSVSFNTP